MEIATSLRLSDNQDSKIARNASNFNNTLEKVSDIVLCKNVSSKRCTYGSHCKFILNNIKIKNNQQSTKNIYFNITWRTSNAEIQNIKILRTNKTIEQQQIHTSKVTEDQVI